MMISRSLYRYRSRRPDQGPLIARIREIAAVRVRYGCQRIHVVLRREGWRVNHKRVYRLYRAAGLSLYQRRPRRHRAAAQRVVQPAATAPNQVWAMDFVSDQLFDGREAAGTDAGRRLHARVASDPGGPGHPWPGRRRSRARRGDSTRCARAHPGRQRPGSIVSKALDRWAYDGGVELAFSRPGKPTDNAHIEAFNGRLRQECLDQHWFLSLDDARAKIEAWRTTYNEVRPHGSLGWVTPAEFARACRASPASTEAVGAGKL